MVRERMTDDNDDFLITSQEEMRYMEGVRKTMEEQYGAKVNTELIDLSPTELHLRIKIPSLKRDDVIIINRQTLTWEL